MAEMDKEARRKRRLERRAATISGAPEFENLEEKPGAASDAGFDSVPEVGASAREERSSEAAGETGAASLPSNSARPMPSKRPRRERRAVAIAEPLGFEKPEDGMEAASDAGLNSVPETAERSSELGPAQGAEESGFAPPMLNNNQTDRSGDTDDRRRGFSEPPGALPAFGSATPDPRQSATPAEQERASPRHVGVLDRSSSRTSAGWTGEPVLLALIVVALIVLAVDTYFTIRLNGLSDRLSALTTKPSANTAPAASVERPWVGPDKVATVAFSGGGQPVTTMHIVNSGRAPALDLRSNTVGSLRSAATPPPEIPKEKGPLATTGTLFPNTGGNLTFFANTRALTPEEAKNVETGAYVLWLAGRLDYKDSKGHAHLTTFRYRYDQKRKAFVATPDGNKAN